MVVLSNRGHYAFVSLSTSQKYSKTLVMGVRYICKNDKKMLYCCLLTVFSLGQIPHLRTCVGRGAVRLPRKERKTYSKRSQKVFPSDNISSRLLSQSQYMVNSLIMFVFHEHRFQKYECLDWNSLQYFKMQCSIVIIYQIQTDTVEQTLIFALCFNFAQFALLANQLGSLLVRAFAPCLGGPG